MLVATLNLLKIVVTPAIASLCLVAIAQLQLSKLSRLNALAHQPGSKAQYVKEEVLEKTNLELLRRSPSLGFDNLIADWTFLKFLQYFGDGEVRQKMGYSIAPEYFEVIVGRDPRFIKSYLFLSSASSIYAGRADQTVALMNKGLKSLSPETSPDAYYVWLYKGTDELLFLGNTKAAQHSHKMAAQWASVSDDPDSKRIAALSRQTAQFLAGNPDSRQAQVNSWTMVLVNSVDNRTRQLATGRIEALGGQVTITPQGEVKVQLPEKD